MQPQGFPYRWEMPHQKHFPVTVTKRERNMKMPFTYTQLRKLKYKSVKSPGLLFCAMNLILMLKKKKTVWWDQHWVLFGVVRKCWQYSLSSLIAQTR